MRNQALQYQAELRLPLSWPRQLKMEKVATVIKLLGLEDCMNSIIGDAKARGISGGQRKRVWELTTSFVAISHSFCSSMPPPHAT